MSADVLVVGAGPVGLMLASELRRHGIACRLIEKRTERSPFCKALGVSPRTLEVWERTGVVGQAIDAGCWIQETCTYVNGQLVKQMPARLPESTYGVLSLPQYETERILFEQLIRLGGKLERGVELVSFQQDAGGVTVQLQCADGQAEAWKGKFLVGCDGAHSAVRHGMDVSFEGDKFPLEFLIADVDLDWKLDSRRAYLFVEVVEEQFRGILVCIPISGRGRFRISTVSSYDEEAPGGKEHSVQDRPPPPLSAVQELVARMAPEPVQVGNLRWSGYFRISHRIVSHYRRGRAFLAGDAAHIHPPTGGQGMNTGIQDAYNLAWKLALELKGLASPDLLDSYEAERLPIGQEIVRKTTQRSMSLGAQSQGEELATLREDSQLYLNYRQSRWVEEYLSRPDVLSGGPKPGDRAPDVAGLRRPGVAYPLRLYELLQGTAHVLLFVANEATDWTRAESIALELHQKLSDLLRCYLIVSPSAQHVSIPELPIIEDSSAQFQKAYDYTALNCYLIRPDGVVGYRADGWRPDPLKTYLAKIFSALKS